MFGLVKKKISPDAAMNAFLDICLEEGDVGYGRWLQDLAIAVELTGGRTEYIRSKVTESEYPWVAYLGAVVAAGVRLAKDAFGDEAARAIYASLHRELSLFPAERSWFCTYVFAIVLDEEAGAEPRGRAIFRHWAKRVGIEQTPEVMTILRSEFFLGNLMDDVALAAIGDFWRKLGRGYVIEIQK